MIDLETLSVTPSSVILTLAAVKFNPFNTVGVTDKLYHKLDVDEQTSMGREINDDTLAWWARQPLEVYEDAMSDIGRISVKQSLKELTKFLVGVGDIWCQGPVFDIVILENIFRQNQMHFPWQYWQIRDSRTLFSVLDFDPRKEIRARDLKAHHNALDDAITQALAVQYCYKKLRTKLIN